MKKTLTFILTAMAFLALALPASAADNYYFVPEYDMLYSLPDWFDVISRETPQDSPLFAKYGTTYEEQMADFAEKDRYCYAIWPENNIGISLTIYDEEMDIPDYNSLTDERLEKYIDLYINMYEDGGYTVIDHSIYNSPQMKYVCLEYTAQGWYALRYNCYYQGHNYEINIISRQPADRTTRLALRNMADSCYIQSFSYRNPIDTDIPPTTYTDSRYDLSFTLPANWQIGNEDPDIEYVDAIFNYPADSFVCMTYGSLDLYAMLSPEEQSLVSRQEFDISYLDEIEMLEYLMTAFPEGVSAREVHSVTYNGCEYFQIDMDVTLPGLPVVQHLTSMYTVKNGIEYSFGLYGSENSRYFEDLERLLQTVSYPGTAGATLTDSFINGALSGLLFALLAVVLRIIFSAISGKKQKNKGETAVASAPAAPHQPAVSPQPAPQKTAKAPQQSPQPAAESTVYCHSCGSPNPKGNSYCINCGTKLADFSEENHKGNTHSICDTRQSATAQYDRVTVDTEHRHSERSEESHLQKITTPPKAESHPAPQPAAKIKVKAVKATPADKASKNKK